MANTVPFYQEKNNDLLQQIKRHSLMDRLWNDLIQARSRKKWGKRG